MICPEMRPKDRVVCGPRLFFCTSNLSFYRPLGEPQKDGLGGHYYVVEKMTLADLEAWMEEDFVRRMSGGRA